MRLALAALPLVVAACAEPRDDLVAELVNADVSGCARIAVAGRVVDSATDDVVVQAFVDVDDPQPADLAVGASWTRDLLADPGGAFVDVAFGEDLRASGPCSHTPASPAASGRADTGLLTITVVDAPEVTEAGAFVEVNVELTGVAASLDDGERVGLPNLFWTGVDVLLDAE